MNIRPSPPFHSRGAALARAVRAPHNDVYRFIRCTLLLAAMVLTLSARGKAMAQTGAMSFASGGYVNVPNFNTLGVTSEVTIEFWAFVNATGDHSAFAVTPMDNSNRVSAHISYINGNSYWDFGNIGTTGRLSAANPPSTIGIWKHYAVVASQSGSFMRIYVDGALHASSSSMDTWETAVTSALRIGGPGVGQLNGKLDEFRVWNVARSVEEIAATRNVSLTGSEAGLKLYFKFDEPSGTTAINSATSTGSAFNGTVTGNATRAQGIVRVVTNTNDSGAGSLRQAIADAHAGVGSEIVFDPSLSGQTITFGSHIDISYTRNITINASGLENGITLSGGGTTRLFNTLAYVYDSAPTNQPFTLIGLTLADGNGEGFYFDDYGGVMLLMASNTVMLRDCTLRDSSVTQAGGAIYHTQGRLVMINCTLTGNSASEGGAIAATTFSATAHATLTHCTVTRNHASSAGGGIHVNNTTDSPLTLNNSIVSGNTSSGAADIHNKGQIIRIGHSIVSGLVNDSSTGGGTVSGAGVMTLSPSDGVLLGGVGNYGGPSETTPLHTASPYGINQAQPCGVLRDQRGLARGSAAWGTDFSGGLDGALLRGGAVITANSLRLTTSATDQQGTLLVPDLGAMDSFTAAFDFRFNPNANRGVGFTFNFGPAPIGTVNAFGISPGHSIRINTLSSGTIEYVKDSTVVSSFPNVFASGGNTWHRIVVTLKRNGKMTVTVNGTFYTGFTDVDSGYTYAAGDRFCFGASTGGSATAEHLLDNAGILTNPAHGASDIGAVEANVGVPGFAAVVDEAHDDFNGTDEDGVSLREAIYMAMPGSSVTFAPQFFNGSVTRLGHELRIEKDVTIDGRTFTALSPSGGKDGYTLSGDSDGDGTGDVRILAVAEDRTVALHALTMEHGHSYNGGGIANGGHLTLSQCTISDCTAAGAGAAFGNYGAATATLTNCTLTRNTAASASLGQGGAFVVSPGTQLTLNHCTVSGNLARQGGGLYVAAGGSATVRNTILAGNSLTSDAGAIGADILNDGGTVTRLDKNLVQNLSGAAAEGSGTFISADPELGPLARHNSITPTMVPLPDSPAIDDAAVIPSLTVDQRDFPRSADGSGGGTAVPDIGAVEVKRSLVTTKLDQLDTPTGAATSLREALRDGVDHVLFSPSVFTGGAANVIALGSTLEIASSVLVDATTVTGGITLNGGNARRVASVAAHANVTFAGAVFTGGSTPNSGAGLYNSGNLTLDLCIVSANKSLGSVNPGLGGGLYNEGSLTLLECTVSANEANQGGGIFNDGHLSLMHSTVSGNTASKGAGIYNAPDPNNYPGAAAELVRCTLAGNTATIEGGGLWSTGSLTLEHCTVGKNSAPAGFGGGAIFRYAVPGTSTLLRHSIISGNNGSDLDAIHTGGSPLFTAFTNILGQVDSFTAPVFFTGNEVNTDALLAPLGNNGGITQTMALLSGSPARDYATVSSSTEDQRGFEIFNAPDAGAYESQLGIPADATMVQNSNSGALPFMVGNVGALTASAANTTLFPAGSMVLGGAGMNRTITLTPAAAKSGTSVVTVLNGAGGESRSFLVTVRSNGTLAFARSVVAQEGAPAFLEIVRTGGNAGTVTVKVSTTATGSTATASTDYAIVTNQLVTFFDGMDIAHATIPTLPDSLVEGNEAIAVTLSGPTGGAVLGAQSTARVTIIDPSAQSPITDTIVPGASITTPALNAVIGVNSGGTISVTGSATDNKGVEYVHLRAISSTGVIAGPFTAELGTPGAPSTSFTGTVVPWTGANTLELSVRDYAGRITTVTRAFKVTRPLLVSLSSTGTVTAGFLGSTYREVGKQLSITATAGTGTIFNGWTLGGGPTAQQIAVTPTALEKNTLTFTFREGLTLTANFVPNPFTSVAGSYAGLVTKSDVPSDPIFTTRSNSSEGYLSATLQSTGAFSGKIHIDSFELNVAGIFDAQGKARFGTGRARSLAVARPNKPSLIVELDVTLAPPYEITGVVSSINLRQSHGYASISRVEASRAYYNGTTLKPTHLLGAADTDGAYTVFLPRDDAYAMSTLGLAWTDYPQGEGVALVKVSRAGLVTFTGTLPDGTTLTASGSLSAYDDVPLFASLYGKLGFLSGWMEFDPTHTDHDLTVVDNFWWSRPTQLTQQWYPYGWPEVMKINCMGTRYSSPGLVLKLPGGAPIGPVNESGNAELGIFLGGTAQPIYKGLNITPANVVTKVPDNDATFTMSLVPSTGMITGTFLQEDDTLPTYQCVIIQRGPYAGAHGFFLTVKPPTLDYLGVSGRVQVLGKP